MESRKRSKQPDEQGDSNAKRVKKSIGALFRGQGSGGTSTSSNTVPEEETAFNQNESTSQTIEHTHDKSNQVNLANESHIARDPVVKPMSARRKALKRLFESGVVGPVTDALGPIKQVAEIFGGCVDAYQVAGRTKVEYDELVVRLKGLFEDLVGYFGDGCSQPMTASMSRLCISIEEELEAIQNRKAKNRGARHLVANDEADAIMARYRRVEGYLERLSLNADLSMWKLAHEQATNYQSDRMFSLIDRLPSVLSARYNSAEGEALKRRECTPGTRVQEIAMVLGWVRNRGDGAVYWLNGMAGTGKTTIAYSTCAVLDSAHMLGASFFCSRLRDECRNVNMIIPSIAYQLARFSRPFHHALCNALEKDPDAHGKQLHMQFNALIKNPILQVQHTLPEELIVVIDALDECENKESTGRMLDVILRESARLPIKFVLSSRPEPEIRDQMSEQVKSRLVLHELDKGKVQVDIETYLRAELSQMSPSEEQITALVDKAGILFIYAATVVRYIGYDNFQSDPHDRLRTILATPESQDDGENEEIDQLYIAVLEAALGNRRLRKVERDNMQQVLHTVICARDPLTVSGLSELLRVHNVDRVRAVLRPLWSILHIVGESELVTTLHASFPDFILDPIRSKAYHCIPETHNRILAEHCLERIERTRSQFNICGLESSYLPDHMVPSIRERVATAISSDLLYACRYWADHVEAGKCASTLTVQLQAFLSKRLLLWMEVLNLNKDMRTGTECMKRVVEWCNRLENKEELVDLANDAQRFVDTFATNPVSQSTPHIYISMLTFWPSSSPITKHYMQFTHGPVEAEGTALGQRQLAHLAMWAFEGAIHAMAVSPDGRYLAIGISQNVLVVDSSSGQRVLGPLHGHSNTISTIMFSPDGARVVAGSWDFKSETAKIIGWNTHTGGIVLGLLILAGFTRSTPCLSFWPDCTCIASGFDGKTVRIWDATTSKLLRSLEADDWVRVVAFSPDGILITAGFHKALQVWNSQTGDITLGPLSTAPVGTITFSPDSSRIAHVDDYTHTVYVWDAQNGQLIHKLSVATYDRTDYVLADSIGFSPDNRRIASSKCGVIDVWDAQDDEMILGPLEGHINSRNVTYIAFSPDGSRIISACEGGIVCTWDARQRSFGPISISMHTNDTRSAKFSLDGQYFVSGSFDGSLRIWDSHTGAMTIGPIIAHTAGDLDVNFLNDGVVTSSRRDAIVVCNARSGELLHSFRVAPGHDIACIAFSQDGNLIATVSKLDSSHEVNLWDAHTGTKLLGSLTGFCGSIESAWLSPDGARLVASSRDKDKQLVVWGVADGRNLFGFLNGHTDSVHSASYSSNGALIASGSMDNTIIVWDAYTGYQALGPLVGHSGYVSSVCFSPDSTCLVSGSGDRTIRIWEVQTGEIIFALLDRHENTIKSVAYSPDGAHILSVSYDGTLRIHNIQSTAERALLRSTTEIGDWVMNKDGWIVDDQSRLLVWVPGDLRRTLMLPRNEVAVTPLGYVRVKFDKSRMGESWAQSYTSQC